MANTLITHNSSRTGRRLEARPSNPAGEVHVLQWPSMEQEAQGLARIVQERIQSGDVAPGKVLVLAPRRQFGYAVRDAINAKNVPAHSFFHEEALEGNPGDPAECAAQEAFTLLTLLVRPDDPVGLRCWCGYGSSSLRKGAWERVRQRCEATGEAPKAILEQLTIGSLSLPHTAPLVQRFRQLQQRIAGLNGLRGIELVDALFPSNASWAVPIRLVTEQIGDNDEPTGLLDLVQRSVTQPELPTDVDYVRVMSLHKSKGLTAQLVVVSGCIEGLIPTIPVDATPSERMQALEEQRRLFYVAITRTTRTLVLSSVSRLPRAVAYNIGASVHGRGRVMSTIASRFLGELGPERPPAVAGATVLQSEPA
jgi:superfamily I DNA/RNA helicase